VKHSSVRSRFFRAILFVFILVLAGPVTSHAQIDVAVYGERMAGEDLYGVGGAVMLPIKGYAFDIALGGNYFFAPSDTTSPWMVNLDTHQNLFTYRVLRPYYGVGLNYYNRDGDRVGVNLKFGVYVRLQDWLVPYVQYTYRTIPSIEHSYMQVGARIIPRSR
jgi:hypothetical protein